VLRFKPPNRTRVKNLTSTGNRNTLEHLPFVTISQRFPRAQNRLLLLRLSLSFKDYTWRSLQLGTTSGAENHITKTMSPSNSARKFKDARADIQRMKLYQRVDRLERALQSAIQRGESVGSAKDFAQLDQLHYEGGTAVDRAIAKLALGPGKHVLDAGSGLGGPARWMAERAGCRVDAIELQPELDEAARKVTAHCGLDDRVAHICGDLLDGACGPGPYDALVSWLVFLHIPDRPRLLETCRNRLIKGAGIYVEDFFIRSPLTPAEAAALENEVYCSHLVDQSTYVQELEAADFGAIEFEDRTEVWRDFVITREAQFRAGREAFVAAFDAETYEGLASFYQTMRRLFEGGRLGGCCVFARAGGHA
jgi:cyclopropane fatty-acyl-phospholipid synthase-like methyltransferase